MKPIWFYVEYMFAVFLVLFLLFSLLGRFLENLGAWNLFAFSYLISRLVIWLVADVLKIRLLRPLMKAKAARALAAHQNESLLSHENYTKMNYGKLRAISKDTTSTESMNEDSFRLFELAFYNAVQKRLIHIHHFILGIPLMPLTWILYFYHVTWGSLFYMAIPWGMVVAGSTFALFMSEFYQLLTQEWGP